LLALQVVEIGMGNQEVEKDEPSADKLKRMLAPVAEIGFVDRAIESPRKDVVDAAVSQIVADGGVTALQNFLGENGRSLAPMRSGELKVLPQREVTGVRATTYKNRASAPVYPSLISDST
jgi:hypothetical protein